MERGHDRRPRVQTWNPPLVLNGSPFLLNSSIKDFQKRKAGYVANALEHPLLLPDNMADLRTMKEHEVFLTLKRDLALVSFSFSLLFFFFSFFFLKCFNYFNSFPFFFFYKGNSSYAYGRGTGEQFPPTNERGGRTVHSYCGGLYPSQVEGQGS